MLRRRNSLPFLAGLGVLLAIVAISSYTNLASAQQTSTGSTLSAPVLTAQAEEGKIELSWTVVTDAARYELWTWTSADLHQQLDDGSLTDTTYSHTDLTVGMTYHYWVRAVSASGEMSVLVRATGSDCYRAVVKCNADAHGDTDLDDIHTLSARADRADRREWS